MVLALNTINSARIAAAAAGFALIAGAPALAADGEDYEAAEAACTAAAMAHFEVAEEAQEAVSVRVTNRRTRRSVIKLDLRLSGVAENRVSVYCEYNFRDGELTEFTVN